MGESFHANIFFMVMNVIEKCPPRERFIDQDIDVMKTHQCDENSLLW